MNMAIAPASAARWVLRCNHFLRWCVHPSGHGNAIVDGTADLYNSCATPPKTCSDSCKCTWVPQDVWSFFTSL